MWVVAAGFALTILLLLGSGSLSIEAMGRVETRSRTLREHHRVSSLLIDEIQGEEAGLSGIFYAIAAGHSAGHKEELERKLSAIEQAVYKTLEPERPRLNPAEWNAAKHAVERFISEVRNLLGEPVPPATPPASVYRAYENVVLAVSSLVAANYQAAIDQEARMAGGNRELLQQALVLLAIALALSIACAAMTVRIAAKVFRRTEWQAKELSRLSGHVMETHEQILHRFSRELHDEFGQSLTAIEANLAAVPAESPEVVSRVEDCMLLVKDAMSNVRELAQILRPSMLDDFGLAPSIQWLAESFSQRTGIAVEPRIQFDGRLQGEVETHLFRIAQEALTNVARHSGATRVRLQLEAAGGALRLTVADNGTGLKPGKGGGLGLTGMRERMRVVGGNLTIDSQPGGVSVYAEVKLDGK